MPHLGVGTEGVGAAPEEAIIDTAPVGPSVVFTRRDDRIGPADVGEEAGRHRRKELRVQADSHVDFVRAAAGLLVGHDGVAAGLALVSDLQLFKSSCPGF